MKLERYIFPYNSIGDYCGHIRENAVRNIIAESVKKTGRLLIIDEDFEPCSIATQISSKISDIAFDYLDAPIKLLNGSFSPTPYSPCLENEIIPSKEIIKQKIVEMFNE